MSQPNKSPVPIELISDLLLNLQATLKSFRLYPLQHPLLVSSIDKLKQAINQFFTTFDTLRLRLKRQYIFVSGQLVNKGDEVLENLSMHIYRLGIRELIFNQGLADDELIKFLQFLNTDPAQIVDKEGGETFWEAAQFTSIKINETLRQEIFRISESGESQEQNAGPNDNLSAVILLADFLGGQEKTPSRAAFHLLGTLMSKPGRLAGMLQALSRAEGSDQGRESEKEYIIKAFGKLISLVQQQPIDQQKNLYQQLAQCLGAFEPGIKKALLEHISAGAKSDPAYSQILAEIPAKALVPLLQEHMNTGTSQAEITALVNGLPLSNQGKSSLFRELKIADHLELAEKAALSKPQQQVALSPAEITEIQYQVPPDINTILADLSHYTEQELNEIVKLAQINTPAEREEAFLQVMTELLRIEHNPEKNKILAQTYENRVRIYLDNNIIDWAVKYLLAVKDLTEDPAVSAESRKSGRQLLINLGTREVVQKLVDTVKNIEKDDAAYVQIQKYLTILPGDSTPFLIELLGEEEMLAVRRLLCQVISEISKDNLEYLWNKLADPNWHLVRNIVLILGLINDDRSLSRLGDLLKHDNARVRVEVIKSLGLSSNPRVFDYLLKGLSDKDEQVKIVAIEWLGNIHDQRAIPVLLQIVKKFDPFGWRLNLKREALESLGLLKAQEAAPFLEKLVRGKWVGFIGPRKTLLPEAEKALEQIKGKKKDDR